jgi:hypothetical protein
MVEVLGLNKLRGANHAFVDAMIWFLALLRAIPDSSPRRCLPLHAAGQLPEPATTTWCDTISKLQVSNYLSIHCLLHLWTVIPHVNFFYLAADCSGDYFGWVAEASLHIA